MSLVVVGYLVFLLILRELLNAYYGPDDPKPYWFPWLTYGTYALLVGFIYILTDRLLNTLNLIQ